MTHFVSRGKHIESQLRRSRYRKLQIAEDDHHMRRARSTRVLSGYTSDVE
ncbi:hypothetical protein L917_07105 [Phytophthora nicotianae]|uniref:Uncharacterized protein n=1 Tax=Phytophthora nicotianae TaxID=4792 RepID=W2LEC7_PHYNI|nr:hypothetical protein L917_07105 [Phytophthora nicotianae]